MPKLSLCMIVKDEESRLAKCLESARSAVDEMIVVDTGSADRTVEIAKSFGARVEHFEWCDDFSAARNYGLELAAGDWILQIDADEELEAEDIPNIRSVIERDDLDGVYAAIHHTEWGPSGEPQSAVFPYPRLFRNRPEIRYQGLVHEFLTNLDATTFEVQIRICHNRSRSNEEQKELRQRNEDICRRQLDRDGSNPVAHFSLAGIYLGQQRFEEARQHLEKAVALIAPGDSHYQHFYLMALHYLAGLYGMQNEYEQAVECCHRALSIREDYLDPYFMLGELNFRRGQVKESEEAFLNYLDVREQLCRQPSRALFAQSRINSHDHAHLRLGTLYQQNGLKDLAEQHYQEAVKANPSSSEANQTLARFYTQNMEMAKARHYLAAAERLQEAVPEVN